MTDGGSLAIDAGQSGIKVRHADAAGASEWAGPGIRTDLPLLPQLARCMEDAVESGPLVRRGRTGRLGAHLGRVGRRATCSPPPPSTAFAPCTSRTTRSPPTSARSAIDRGAVVASGTGVVTLAVGRTELARVDGWGYLLGDAGSGYWLGRAALDAVMRAHDGRGDATALSAIALGRVPRPRARLHRAAGGSGPCRAHRRVCAPRRRRGGRRRCRRPGDRDGAGRELAASVIAGLRRVGEADAAAPASAPSAACSAAPR